MRFHVISLPHTCTSPLYNSCAYTAKVLHFVQMMRSLSHEVVHYGNEGSDLGCDAEHVSIFSPQELERFFGRPDALHPIPELDWTGKAPYWELFNNRVATEVAWRVYDRTEFLCPIVGGGIGRDITDRVNHLVGKKLGSTLTSVEWGIGYNGTFSRFRVFESYAHMHKVWGAQEGFDPDGHFYDAVIPNFFDPADYPLSLTPQDYFLYLGRVIHRKGVEIAVQVTRHLDARLVIAGQGVASATPGKIVAEDGTVYQGDHLDYVGMADKEKRAKLFAGARAVFVPTIYVEPFGGVAVEAQMAGTPVITTDFGAFTETVEQGVTGFRCRTLREFVEAARKVGTLDRQYIHDRAVRLYSMAAVGPQYDRYFRSLLSLWGTGWSELPDIRQDVWDSHQQWESQWWGDCQNARVEEEKVKQALYLKYLGLGDFNMGGRSVLDVGGGPSSILLRAKNVGRRKVVDPLDVPAWVGERYRAAGIEYDKCQAEDMDESGWDMALIYNVLQHTRDPKKIIQNARKAAKELRMFEWINVPPCAGHPHMLHQEDLEAWTGQKGLVVKFPGNHGFHGSAWVIPPPEEGMFTP